ncbi:hypothetical protein VDG05_21590, partial [Xanthomonas campestris pv. raphani]|nr:hypothetical protein [Xanthomonas campestris pv. raphani]
PTSGKHRYHQPRTLNQAATQGGGTSLAIAAKVNELRKKRDAFLSKAHAQLASDPLLLASFEDPLRGLNGEHYWATLDPNSTLKRRA